MTQKIGTQSNAFEYAGRRRCFPDVAYDLHVGLTSTEFRPANEGSLEHFLLERYTLVTQSAGGSFLTAEVSHHPYEFVPVNVLQCRETYTSSLRGRSGGCGPPDHAVYVRVSRLEQIN